MPAFLTRALLALSVLVCTATTVAQGLRYLDWAGYQGFAAELVAGRAETSDLDDLAPVLARPQPEPCAVFRDTDVVMLHFYAADLLALQAGVNPFLPATDPTLEAQRRITRAVVESALACAPVDGNLWLGLATIARALDAPPHLVAQYLDLSQRYAPHEAWIARRRDRLFPSSVP